jgi:hypothetical protein
LHDNPNEDDRTGIKALARAMPERANTATAATKSDPPTMMRRIRLGTA